MEKSSTSQEFPIAKAASSFLQETLSSSFGFPGWNRGRIVCQRTQLKKVLSGIESSSEGSKNDRLVILSNSPFSPRGTRISQRNDNPCTEAKERKKRELVTSKAWRGTWNLSSVLWKHDMFLPNSVTELRFQESAPATQFGWRISSSKAVKVLPSSGRLGPAPGRLARNGDLVLQLYTGIQAEWTEGLWFCSFGDISFLQLKLYIKFCM